MGVKLIGFEKLEAKLTKNMDLSAVKTVVKKNGAEMQKKAMKEAPVLPIIYKSQLCWKLQMVA